MSLRKKTIDLVAKVLKDPNKRKLYTPGELFFMEKKLELLKAERKKRLEQRKREKGFGHE